MARQAGRVFAVIGVAAGVVVVWVVPGHPWLDFGLDWLASRTVLMGEDPYQPLSILGQHVGVSLEFQWPHPRTPGALLLLAPLGWLPLELVYPLGRTFVLTTAFFLAWVVARLSNVRYAWCAAVVPLVLLVWPFSYVLALNQSGFLIAGLIGWSWLLSERNDRLTAGIPLGLAVTLRMWPWLLIPALWWSGRRRTAIGVFSTVVGLNLVGLVLPGVSASGVLSVLQATNDIWWMSPSAWIGVSPWIAALIGLGLVYAATRWLTQRQSYAVATAVALIVAPILWPHYLPALLIPIVMLMRAQALGSRDTKPKPRSRDAAPSMAEHSYSGSDDAGREHLEEL